MFYQHGGGLGNLALSTTAQPCRVLTNLSIHHKTADANGGRMYFRKLHFKPATHRLLFYSAIKYSVLTRNDNSKLHCLDLSLNKGGGGWLCLCLSVDLFGPCYGCCVGVVKLTNVF